MIAAALRAEADEYVERFADEVDEDGHRRVVRNGRAQERKVTIGSGTIPIRAPRVNDKRVDEETGQRQKFSSRILPAYARRSPKVGEVIPILYLRGLSTGDFRPALEGLLGEDAAGLSPTTIARHDEGVGGAPRPVPQAAPGVQPLRVPVPGRHPRVRPARRGPEGVPADRDRRPRGRREGAARGRGRLPREHRELGRRVPRHEASRAERAEARRRRRRLGRVGGAARRLPRRREQRCWFHASGNIIDCLPKRLHSRAKGLLSEIIEAPTRGTPELALEVFREEYGAKYPKALAKLDRDWAQLTAFYDYPAEHWRHLRTTNPIESAFATVRLRTRVTKGAGSKTAALAMAYKLLATAQERWRRFNGHHLVADVLDGVKFKDGIKVTDDDNHDDGSTDERVAA